MLPAWWQLLRATGLSVMGSCLVKGPMQSGENQGLGGKVCADTCGDNTGEGQERGRTKGESAPTKRVGNTYRPNALLHTQKYGFTNANDSLYTYQSRDSIKCLCSSTLLLTNCKILKINQ